MIVDGGGMVECLVLDVVVDCVIGAILVSRDAQITRPPKNISLVTAYLEATVTGHENPPPDLRLMASNHS